MSNVVVSTLDTIPGARIIRTMGYVGSMGQHNKGIEELQKLARGMGANAVVGVRWLPSHWAQPGYVYGTAVVIEPEAG